MGNSRREVVPARGPRSRPVVVEVRLVCAPDGVDAAVARMAAAHGDAWQPSTRKTWRDGRACQYGTLIIAVPR